MGLDEIVIPFDKLKNRIVLIQGANGTGKSTILNTLTPNVDSSDSFRTDIYIDDNLIEHRIEYPGEKEIHYIDDSDGSIYRVFIQSLVNESKTTRTTKAYISKNGVEFNPNGNVSSFKEMRDELFEINSTYLSISAITSENRGLVDMIPSERRKYLSSFIGSLDMFNNINKILSKKTSEIKGQINSLGNKIYSLGNGESLEISLKKKGSDLESMKRDRDTMIKNLASAETLMSSVDPDHSIQILYESISEDLSVLKSKININNNDLRSLYNHIGLTENDNFSKLLDETNTNISDQKMLLSQDTDSLKHLMTLSQSMSDEIERNKAQLASIESSDFKTNVEYAVNDLKDLIASYETVLSKDIISLLNKVSLDEMVDLRDNLDKFLELIKTAEGMYDQSIFEKCIKNILLDNIDPNSIYRDLLKRKSNIEDKIKDSKLELSNLENDNKKIMMLSNRPNSCKDDTCPFIKDLVDIGKKYEIQSVDTCIESVQKSIHDDLETLANIESEMDDLSKIFYISATVKEAISVLRSKSGLINKLEPIRKVMDNKWLYEKLRDRYLFMEFSKVTDIIEAESIYEDYKKSKDKLVSLEADLKVYRANRSMVDSLTNSITQLEEKMNHNSEEIKRLNKHIVFLNDLLNNLNAKSTMLSAILDKINAKKSLDEKMLELKSKFSTIKDNIRLVKEKADSVNSIKNSLVSIDKMIDETEREVSELKFSVASLYNYNKEIATYKQNYERMLFIKNACSPGSGTSIQSEYVKMYMNDIISTCNSLLSYMFNGSIKLQLPIIGDKDFSIPFIGPFGMVVPDVSYGSTAQKCMIGLAFSCASLLRSSTKYNIPRLDEIDGGLDTENRYGFITALNFLLDTMNTSQCIMISHNNEFDTQSVSKIICTKSGFQIIE